MDRKNITLWRDQQTPALAIRLEPTGLPSVIYLDNCATNHGAPMYVVCHRGRFTNHSETFELACACIARMDAEAPTRV
jgi:hypothetical protein